MSKEYWRLLESKEITRKNDFYISSSDGRWKECSGGKLVGFDTVKRRITVPAWPTPIAFADEKPKEGQKILYWQPIAKEWRREPNFSVFHWDRQRQPYGTHWLPAPPDLPEPKPAWEVAWEEFASYTVDRDFFKAIWDRAQKERV